MKLSEAKLGDVVMWTSSSAGCTRTKVGTIVEIVPSFERPRSTRRASGQPRNHTSFVVKASVIDGSENQRKTKKLYWPKVSQLMIGAVLGP